MRVVHLAAGAAGMYCGSCLHDNRLAATLRAQGRDVVLLPLYTPLRTDELDASSPSVFYGGINVYLQQASTLFRHTPRLIDWLFDRRPLLNAVGRFTGATRPEDLGALTRSILRGPAGRQRKELRRLISALRALRPALVHLPNLMFAGAAPSVSDALDVPVVCGLAGEDVFLDRLPEPYRAEVFNLIRQQAGAVQAFVAPTRYYARHAASHFGLPADRVHTVPMGIHTADFEPAPTPAARPFTIGFLAHVCEAKGLAELCRALVRLRQAGRDCRVRAAGYLGPADRPYLRAIQTELRDAGLGGDDFQYVGELDRRGKRDFLRTLHALSVPTSYVESKGFYVLEALAAGVPVVQPDHGSFPELVEDTGGGLLHSAGRTSSLAEALALLMDDEDLRRRLAEQGRAAVRARHDAAHTATATWRLYEQVVEALSSRRGPAV